MKRQRYRQGASEGVATLAKRACQTIDDLSISHNMFILLLCCIPERIVDGVSL